MGGVPPRPKLVPFLSADASAVRRCGADLLAASSQIDDTGTYAAGTGRVTDWTGESADSYRTNVRQVGGTADAMSLALRGVAQRVDVHADELDALKVRRDNLVEWRGNLVTTVTGLEQDAQKELTSEERATFDAECERVAGYIRTFEADVDTWSTDLSTEETEMIAAFDRVQTMESVERHYAGVADPADAALASKPGAGATPQQVNDWWNSLTRDQQLAIIAASPGSIGNLDGIPAVDRDDANRNALTRDLADLENTESEGTLTGDEEKRQENAEAARQGLTNIETSYDPETDEPIVAQLYIYDPDAFDGDGAIAISAGNLDTADNVTVQVPGFGNDAGSAPSMSDRMVRLYEAARIDDPSQTNASMTWIGYDSPDNFPIKDGWGSDGFGVVSEDLAQAGGDRLADTIDGLRAGRSDDPSHLTVIGHSYGSTVTGIAAHEHDLDVDDIVFLGSPGVGGDTNTVDDLNHDPDHVWAGANSRDLVAQLGNNGALHLENLAGGGLGDDPVEDDFGANRFQAESTTRNEHFRNFDDHGKYFDHDTESLYNITQIVNSDYDEVQGAGHVTDPWYSSAQDPEVDRTPTSPDTDGKR